MWTLPWAGPLVANQLVWHHVPHRRWVGMVLQCSWNLHCIVAVQICNAFCVALLHYIFALCCNIPHVHHTACVCATHQPVGIMLHLRLALLAMCPWPPQSSRAGLAPQSSRALVPQLRFVPCVLSCVTLHPCQAATMPCCSHCIMQPSHCHNGLPTWHGAGGQHCQCWPHCS